MNRILTALALAVFLGACEGEGGLGKPAIERVSFSAPSFNPSAGQDVGVAFTLTFDAKVDLAVYDPDGGLVRRLLEGKDLPAGEHLVSWDGRDLDGAIVPDEAYDLEIVARGEGQVEVIHDPTTWSGGEMLQATEMTIDPDQSAIMYEVPRACRVSVRIGIEKGPLLRTLIDWKPRLSGKIFEQWDGMDTDKLIDLRRRDDCKVSVSCFALPDGAVIAFGNREADYRRYKLTQALGRPERLERPRTGEVAELAESYGVPRIVDRTPPLSVTFPDHSENGLDTPVPLSGRAIVRVDLPDEHDRRFCVSQGFELVFFLDGELISEAEQAYVPYNWQWDVSRVKPGEHLLTVNISGFRGQVGTATRRITVRGE